MQIVLFVPQRDNFCVFHQNIAGILSKIDELEIVIDSFKNKGTAPNVICFSETFLCSGTENNLVLKDYELVSFYSRPKKRGGVAILINKSLDAEDLPNIQRFSIQREFECCGIEIFNCNLIVVCLYRTPDSNINIFFEQLNKILNLLRSKTKSTKKIIICGDFNINTLIENKTTKDYFSILQNFNMISHINKPTRKNNCIDHIISNLKIAKGTTLQLGLSDHDTAQNITFPIYIDKYVREWHVTKRDYSEENIYLFIEHIKQLSFSEIYEENCSDKAFNTFHNLLVLFHNLCFPVIKIKISSKNRKHKWITKSLKRCCTTKRKLYFEHQRSTQNKDLNKQRLHNYTRILKKCISYSQKTYYTKYISNSSNKCKAAWNVIKGNHNQQSKKEIHNITNRQKVQLYTPQEIAEEFNDYFINVNKKYTTPKTYDMISNTQQRSIFLSPTNPCEINKIICSLRNTSSTGFDELPTKIIKSISLILSIPLSYLINISFEQGTFPTILKKSVVKPIFKKGNKSELGNYRPITLIPVIAKIYERAMHNRIESFLDKFNILRDEQNGFRKKKSTTLACFKLNNIVTDCIDKGIPVGVLLLDMTKAFDTVCHDQLLSKLERYGIRGPAYTWIRSYLSERKQCTQIDRIQENKLKSYKSEYKQNTIGVPQGSILGPLLFVMYINDLPESTRHDCILFADDTTIIVKGTNINLYERNVNTALKDVVTWLNKNNLSINLSKTKFMQFRSYRAPPQQMKILHDNVEIEEVENSLFLGMTLDTHCNWKKHVDSVCKRVNKFIFVLWRLKETVSQKTAITTYHAYIESVLRYGILLWGNSVEVDRAFVAQKKSIRTICGKRRRESCRPNFAELKLLTLPSLYIYEAAVFVKQNLELFPQFNNISNRPLRQNNMTLPSCKLKVKRKSAYYMCIRIFNKIPSSIKTLPNTEFKLKFKNILYNACFYTVDEYFSHKF
jgi:exonuclease III